jgi:hypothetical protein
MFDRHDAGSARLRLHELPRQLPIIEDEQTGPTMRSSTFARTPNVKCIVSHAGGTIPDLATRFSIIDEMNVISGTEKRGPQWTAARVHF